MMENILLNKIIHKFTYGDHSITLETGAIANQANASILASMDNTTVLATVVHRPLKDRADILPLSVYYQEKAYAAGIIPGSFFRREGRPTEQETLISRLIDRPIRPLFVSPFLYEIQIIVTLLSFNPKIYPDIISIIAVSAALTLVFSKSVFVGPIGASRIGLIKNFYILNPTSEDIKKSTLDLFIAGTIHKVLMVECQSYNVHEDYILKALKFGHNCQKTVIENIEKFKTKLITINDNVKYYNYVNNVFTNNICCSFIDKLITPSLIKAYKINNKYIRGYIIQNIKDEIMLFLKCYVGHIDMDFCASYLEKKEKNILIFNMFASNIRLDGRKHYEIREIDLKINILHRLHGSAIFTRGDTQALVTVTLGTPRDAQNIDDILGERTDNFILHYNFPHYAVNEIGPIIAPKRREIGHGKLAKKGLIAVMPHINKFPYTIRIVSEITSSNGSSSMATACGASLALMASGVPIKTAVAGIAMGVIKCTETDQYIILSDILGEEDHIGDVDFKVIGTLNGVTALQLDVKNIDILNFKIIKALLLKAHIGRTHIIEVMNKTIGAPKKHISALAPHIHSITIQPEKIKDVIGKGGMVIKKITEETGALIDIKDNGLITIIGSNKVQINAAILKIKEVITDIYVGKVYTGTVVKIVEFGAFITLNTIRREGLLHISNIQHRRVNRVSDHLQIGQEVIVKVLEISAAGRIKLSMKDVDSR